MKMTNRLTDYKLFSLKAIRVSSLFFGIFGVALMVISNLKVFEKLTPEKPPSLFLKKTYPKSYNKEIFRELWLYTIIISLIMFFLILFFPNIPNYLFFGIPLVFADFAYKKFLKKEQTKYLKETTKHSLGRIIWTGLKGVSLFFLIGFFLILFLTISDIQIPALL
tara:strand:- start:87 stop:581 length:495 start_codon:yes stop_codon:yes gene_type:complete